MKGFNSGPRYFFCFLIAAQTLWFLGVLARNMHEMFSAAYKERAAY